MTDELTPEQEAAISRLLAEARYDGPIPADVAARLDAALVDLATGDASQDADQDADQDAATVGPPPVSDLAAHRRRRRNATRLLVAAAAVVVGGVAVGQNLDTGDLAGGDDSTSAEDASVAEAPRDAGSGDGAEADLQDEQQDDGGAMTSSGADDDQRVLDQLGTPLRFTSGNFATEAQRSLRTQVAARRVAAVSGLDYVQAYAVDTLFTCPEADYGQGAKLPAFYDEQEAVLVLRRPAGGQQRVDLLQCGTADELASVELPAR